MKYSETPTEILLCPIMRSDSTSVLRISVRYFSTEIMTEIGHEIYFNSPLPIAYPVKLSKYISISHNIPIYPNNDLTRPILRSTMRLKAVRGSKNEQKRRKLWVP